MIRRFGLIKTSLIDFPGKVSAVLFTHGCNFRCPFCHNPELVSGREPEEFLAWDEILFFLEKRRNVLGGVVITGGEPLMHDDLAQKIGAIRDFGLAVKIDTNGSYPEHLAELAPDFVAMDIKTAFSRYERVLPGGADGAKMADKVTKSINRLISHSIPHQFRTTMVPGIVDEDDFSEIIPKISGAQGYLLSGFRNGRTLDQAFAHSEPYEPQILERIARRLQDEGIPAEVRMNS